MVADDYDSEEYLKIAVIFSSLNQINLNENSLESMV